MPRKTKAKPQMKHLKPTTATHVLSAVDDLAERMSTMDIAGKTETDDTPQPFRFFDLPFELRLRVYEIVLVFPKTIDLDPTNARTIVPFLCPFLVNRRMHDEASRVFYARNTFRIFPVHGRFIYSKKPPLVARLPTRYRSLITRLELRLGPGWTKPPISWITDGRLRLREAGRVRWLRVFVELDPACHPSFEGFGNADNFYTQFSTALLRSLFAQLPGLADVELDGYPGVSKTSPLLVGLINEIKANEKRILWGPERGWDKIIDVDLVHVLHKLGLGAP